MGEADADDAVRGAVGNSRPWPDDVQGEAPDAHSGVPADRHAGLSHPTRGVDVGAQAAIWGHIKRARRAGLAVLLISADLDELIGLSDTIQVILRGRFVGTFDPSKVTPQDLGTAMTGGEAA